MKTKSRKIEGTAWVSGVGSGCVRNAWRMLESQFVHFVVNGERFTWITDDEWKVPAEGSIGPLTAYARIDKDGEETGKLFKVQFAVTGNR